MASHEEKVGWFLDNACAAVVNGPQARARRMNTARRLLEQNPEIARDSIFTAVVCGDLTEVTKIITNDPAAAQKTRPMRVSEHPKYRECDPLMYLCYARLTDVHTTDHAIEIARLLLDNGADPNGHFYFRDNNEGSKYTALCGVAGEGEEDAPPHAHRNELARLLLERGAEPYDVQLNYNTHFHARVLWMLELVHEFSVRKGRSADWADPQWPMLAMGGYGNGARWFLGAAVRNNDLELARWILAHGASVEPDQPPHPKQRATLTMYQLAKSLGFDEMAALLAQHGAPVTDPPPTNEDPVTQMRHAARRDDVGAVRRLLDAGMSVELPDPSNGGQRPLHAAASHNAVNVARLLIDRGAEIDPVESNFDATPLGFAVYGQHREMIELLSAVSNDVWEVTYVGNVKRLAELFAKDPALAKTRTEDGTTPLHWLPDDEIKAADVVELFLKHGADPSARDANNRTPADVAESRGLLQAAKLCR